MLTLFLFGFTVPGTPTPTPTIYAATIEGNQQSPNILHAYPSQDDDAPSAARDMGSWDSDDFPIVVDSATSRTITPVFTDLINPRPHKSTIQGIGTSTITHVGGVRWPVNDLNGRVVYIEDPEAYYCPSAPYRLLCPHSWRESLNHRRYAAGDSEGDGATMCLAPDDQGGYLLSWNRGKIVVEAHLDPTVNLPMIRGRATYANFATFSAAFPWHPPLVVTEEDDPVAEEVMPGDEAKEQNAKTIKFAPSTKPPAPEPRQEAPSTRTRNALPQSITRDEALFLSWHVKLGHAPFRNIRWAAKLGILPPKLAKCENVVCPACLYGKQKRRPWRTKGSQDSKIKKASYPGECVSVDQLVSGTPGLVGQITGRLTKSRYQVATIFVDHYSDLDYVHVQESTSAEDTIEAKRRFEQFCHERGVRIKHYHADNGIFASRAFREEIHRCGQTISFCGVGAHHQNGVAERRIQDLADSARASLTFAAHRNPSVTAHLWPYALRHASYVRRLMPRENHSKSPEEFFTKSQVRPTTKFLHVFGCPVYVLQADLQSGKSIPKWEERSRVGIYLGHSSQHAQNVSLILNPVTGCISPQFHCVYDDNFDSAKIDSNFSPRFGQRRQAYRMHHRRKSRSVWTTTRTTCGRQYHQSYRFHLLLPPTQLSTFLFKPTIHMSPKRRMTLISPSTTMAMLISNLYRTSKLWRRTQSRH